jgi:DNA primase
MTRFDERFLDDVRARTGLVDLIGQEVQLKRKGREHWGCCPFHSEKTPSFSVNEEKGFAHCFGCGWHGDAIDWIKERHGMSFTEAVEDLAIRAGLQPDREGRTRPKAKPIARPAQEDLDREKEDKIAWARKVWSECQPSPGTLVETYLRSRNIDTARLPLGVPPTIRFHPSLRHADTGVSFPTMVAAVQNGQGRLTGIHRTFLKPDGDGKALVTSPKKMAGVVWGGAIRLCPAAATLGIAEGIETALSVTKAAHLPVWVAGSLGNMAALDLPPVVKDLVLCVDADGDQDALAKTIEKAQSFHAARGCRVRIARPPAGMDFNDMLRGVV